MLIEINDVDGYVISDVMIKVRHPPDSLILLDTWGRIMDNSSQNETS